MITYLEFTTRLVLSQLKNTAAVSDADNSVLDTAFEKHILSLTNQGLVDISTRLPIIKRRVRLTFETGKNSYLLSEAGLGDFLTDIDDVFLDDDFLSILGVQDADDKNHPQNTKGQIITPSFNTLRFTDAKMTDLLVTGTYVEIIYQAKYSPIIATENIATYNIDLPPHLEAALQLYVGSLFLSHMNGAEHQDRGDKYFGTYLAYIGKDIADNTSNTSEVFDSERFENNGFV